MASTNWQGLIDDKRASNAAKIPEAWLLPSSFLENVNEDSDLNVLDVPRKSGLLTQRELEITENYDATALAERLATKHYSSYEVALAFCKRAAIAQQLINCLTEIMFDDALARAKECDDYLATTGKVMGPLHGVPVSIKDSFSYKGYQTTMGFVSFLPNPPDNFNSSCVQILLDAGAVFYVKTNIPQTMMCADSINNIFGRTLNPCKLSLTAGGSSGGEGALLHMRGSVLGIGTDIAGSVRLPALCNGGYALKATASRLPWAGQVPCTRPGNPKQVLACPGPEGQSIRDMELFMRIIMDSDPWERDENVIAVPWRRVARPDRKLRLGMILEDPKRPLHPPMLRTMRSAEQALTEAGHTIVPMDKLVPSIWDASVLAWKFFSLDDKDTDRKLLADAHEPIIKSLITCAYAELEGWQPTLDELFEMNVQRDGMIHEFHNIIVEKQLDGFIMPPYQSTAQPHDTFGVVPYTVLANVLNYPAGSIPYLQANKELDTSFVRTGVDYQPPYDASAIEGAPSGIQVVGRPMKDEELLNVMMIVEEALAAASNHR